MKKIIAFLLMLLMVFSLVACSGNDESSNADKSKPESTENNMSAAQDENDDSDTQDAADNAQAENNSESSEEGSSDTAKILVVYFSATNTTKGVAEMIADSLDADLYEITPKEAYTKADLDYNDDDSRSTIEMNDSSAKNLERLTSGATWLSGYCLSGGDSHSSIVKWINDLDLDITAQ